MNYEQRPDYKQPYNIRIIGEEDEDNLLDYHLRRKEHRRQKYECKDKGNKNEQLSETGRKL